jgi:hypothetical protein
MPHGLQFGGALLEAGAEVFSPAAGVFRLQARLPASAHVQVELDGAVGPVLDFLDQALAHGSELFVSLALAAARDFCRVFGHQVLHSVGQGTGLDVAGDPIGPQHVPPGQPARA